MLLFIMLINDIGCVTMGGVRTSMASLLLDGEREDDDDHGVPSSLLQRLKIPVSWPECV